MKENHLLEILAENSFIKQSMEENLKYNLSYIENI